MDHKIYAKLTNDGGLLSVEPYFTSFDPRVIVREETPVVNNILNSYHVFNNMSVFEKWYTHIPDKTKFVHEVMVSNAYGNDYMPQRFVFDIDCEKSRTSRDAMFEDFLAKLKMVFWDIYNVALNDDDIYWCDSSDDNKFSRHVYLDRYYAMNAYENRALVLMVNEKTGLRGKCSDEGIYTQNHCLRLVYSRKHGSNRVKLPHGNARPLSDYFVRLHAQVPITQILNKFSMPEVITDFNMYKTNIEIPRDIPDYYIKSAVTMILRGYPQGCRFIRNIGNLLLFVRVAAADCPICKVRHEKDNTMYGFISNNDVYIMCRHSPMHLKDPKARICVGNIGKLMA
ncbi:helicase/primase [Faustovirus]|nr:helicase/primase [Faustovirus]AMN84531.1 helicase/primase [Faustovirus]QKE50229.1 putative helicase/primase complex protein [Faustovirus]